MRDAEYLVRIGAVLAAVVLRGAGIVGHRAPPPKDSETGAAPTDNIPEKQSED